MSITGDVTLYPSGANSSGDKSLGIDFGKNAGRSPIVREFVLLDGDDVQVGNKLTIIQEAASLVNNYASGETGSRNGEVTAVAQSFTFTGVSNGKYLKYAVTGQGHNVTGCFEYSNVSASQIGTSYTQVANPPTGSSTYNYTITVQIPANTSAGDYVVSVTAADSISDTGITKSYTVSVISSAVALNSVTMSDASLVLGVNDGYQLSYIPDPSNATITSEAWEAYPTGIVSVNGSGYVTAIAEGSTYVEVIVNGNKSASCYVTVYDAGTMSASDVSVNGSLTTGSSAFSYNNIKTNTISVSSNQNWVSGAADPSNNPYQILLTLSPNGTSSSRSATLTITAEDMLGDTITETFTVTQGIASCNSMEISGAATIDNSGNSANYTVSYLPVGTVQDSCVWSIDDGFGGDVSSIVELDNETDSGCTVKVKSGASNDTVSLKATNSDNSNIYDRKSITITYNIPGDITVSSNSVNIAATATSDNSVIVTMTNIIPNGLSVYTYDGFITGAQIQTSGNNTILVISCTQNTNTALGRTGSVTLNAIDTDSNIISTVIQYNQAAAESPNVSISITSFTISMVSGKVDASFTVAYSNNGSAQQTFSTPSYTILGYDSSNNVATTKTGSLSSVTVAGHSATSVTYSYPDESYLRWIGSLDNSYTVQVSANGVSSSAYNGTIDTNPPLVQ